MGAAAGAASPQAVQAAEPGWKHALTDPPAAAPGVEVLYWFPDHGRLQFPVGTQVTGSTADHPSAGAPEYRHPRMIASRTLVRSLSDIFRASITRAS